jgi:hypothetical protein
MACRCGSNTLGLFIRSVAQIDLSATSNFTVAGKLQTSSNRYASTTRHFGAHRGPRRFYSTSIADVIGHSTLNSSEPVSPEGSSTEAPPQPGQGPIVEFSMDAIDALAAESDSIHETERKKDRKTEEHHYETPLNALMKDLPRKKEKSKVESRIASRSVFREPDSKFYTNDSKPMRSKKDDWEPPPREPWMVYKEKLKEKFPEGYQPLKRLSPDAIAGIRALHAQMPERYTSWALSQEFKVSPEAIRRILKSKWTPDSEEESDRAKRWFKRGERVWSRYSQLGVKPPKKWREAGVAKPEWILRKREKFMYEAPALPALITTSRRNEQIVREVKHTDLDSFADKIL